MDNPRFNRPQDNVAADRADMTFDQLIDAFEAEVDWRAHNRENWRNALQVACQFFSSPQSGYYHSREIGNNE